MSVWESHTWTQRTFKGGEKTWQLDKSEKSFSIIFYGQSNLCLIHITWQVKETGVLLSNADSLSHLANNVDDPKSSPPHDVHSCFPCIQTKFSPEGRTVAEPKLIRNANRSKLLSVYVYIQSENILSRCNLS